MGLDGTGAQALCAAKSLGAEFSRSIMIGRQCLSVPPNVLDDIAAVLGHAAPDLVGLSEFAEPFFEWFGATAIDSLDISDFEGATVLHDMNLPIPSEMRGRYDVVFDGGSLEHVFNVVQAFSNCMEMLRPGGHFVQVNNANNFMGHGFWQFSPELMYRIFAPANGFKTLGVFLRELHQLGRRADLRGDFYLARDPDELGWRVELSNRRPTYIITIAQRTAIKPIFATAPQQSDYQRLWAGNERGAPPAGLRTNVLRQVRRVIPQPIEKAIRGPFRNRAYARVRPADFIRGRIPPVSLH
jgi:SAM-dependent methyltransferase